MSVKKGSARHGFHLLTDKMCTEAVTCVSAVSACILQGTLKKAVLLGCRSYQASQPQQHWGGLLEESNQNSGGIVQQSRGVEMQLRTAEKITTGG